MRLPQVPAFPESPHFPPATGLLDVDAHRSPKSRDNGSLSRSPDRILPGVKNLLAVLIALCPVVAMALAVSGCAAAQIPHPAVVRVIAAEQNGASLGTGALVAVDEAHGLVVTNWHVVRDATGPITVVFPDGFRSGALLLKTDRDWDLAALAIQRPQAQPLPLATEAAATGRTAVDRRLWARGGLSRRDGPVRKVPYARRKPPARDPGSRRRGAHGVIPADRFATAAARLPASCLGLRETCGPAATRWAATAAACGCSWQRHTSISSACRAIRRWLPRPPLRSRLQ